MGRLSGSSEEGLVLPEYVYPSVRPFIPEAYERALQAGAKPPLTYVGAGQYGIVFCDNWGHAWKVARLSPDANDRERLFMLESVAEEYEWLRDAARTEIAPHVAKVYAIHEAELVLERECVDGHPGTWGDDGRLRKLHHKIWDVMIPVGWTAPEFKEDSYIIRPSGQAVLVDISMALRVGENLAGWVEDVLLGRRKTRADWHDLAFYLYRERREGTIPKERADPLLRRLLEKDPGIEKSFRLDL
jgi:hypothetical protein